MSVGANTFIAGVAKAGTTWLYKLLGEHAEVWAPEVKEPAYYAPWADDRRQCDRATYAALYEEGRSRSARVLLEGSVRYLYDPQAVIRVLRDVPDARFIVSVRSPVRTIASLHDDLVNEGYQPEPDLLNAWERSPPPDANDWTRYRDVIKLGDQVRRILNQAGAPQVHLIRFDDLVNVPVAGWDSLCSWLGLSEMPLPRVSSHATNSSADTRSVRAARLLRQPPYMVRRLARLFPRQIRIEVGRGLKQLNSSVLDRDERQQRWLTTSDSAVVLDQISLLESLTGWDLGEWRTDVHGATRTSL